MHIANFTDYFRVILLHKKGGWWFDTDTYCINKLPKLDLTDRGVIFSSLPTKSTGRYAVRRGLCQETKKIRGKIKPWHEWHGNSQFSNGFMYANKGHEIMKKIVFLNF